MIRLEHMHPPAPSEISALRARMRWSQQEMAVVLGRSVGFISRCENGKEQMTWRDWMVLRVLAAAEIDPERWPPPPSSADLLAA